MSIYKVVTDNAGNVVSIKEEVGGVGGCFGILVVVSIITILSQSMLKFLMTYQLWVYLSLAITIGIRFIWNHGFLSTLLSLSTFVSSIMWYGVLIDAKFGYVHEGARDNGGLFKLLALALTIPVGFIVGMIFFTALIYVIDLI